MLGNFSKYLKEKRLQLGLSREELAELADTTATVIYRIENGKEKPGKDLSDRLQKALGAIINNGWVEEPIDRAAERINVANLKILEYKEFRSIIRSLYKMSGEDIHKVYEFINDMNNERRNS